jgi:hypothetical protein
VRLLERKVEEMRPRVTQQMQALQSAKSVDLASEDLQADGGIPSERLRSSERDERAEQPPGSEREAELQAELGRSRASSESQSAVERLSVYSEMDLSTTIANQEVGVLQASSPSTVEDLQAELACLRATMQHFMRLYNRDQLPNER